MAEGRYWRKAMMISLFLHGILLLGLGWVVANESSVAVVSETYLELEWVDDGSGKENPPAKPVHSPSAAPVAKLNQVSVAEASPAVQEAIVETAVDSMIVLSAETGSSSSSTGVSNGSAVGGAASGENGSGVGASSAGKSGKGGAMIGPSILAKVEPTYPERARQAGQTGTVVLKIQIGASGRPEEVTVYRSSGYNLLDEAAIKAVWKWRFVPAQNGVTGQSVTCNTTLPVVFALN